MEGQYSIFDCHSKTEKLRPCDYRFRRYIGQKVKFNPYCCSIDDKVHTVTGIEQYYTIVDEILVGTPTTIYPVREEDYIK